MRFAPPINSTDEEIDFGLSVLDASITQALESHPGKAGQRAG